MIDAINAPQLNVGEPSVSTAVEARDLAEMLLQDRKPVEAAFYARLAAQLNPRSAWNWTLLGACYYQAGDFAEARLHTEHALKISPYLPAALWNLSLVDLFEENWEAGWNGYEWGFARNFRQPKTLVPAWDGNRDLNDRTIWVWAEQGLGDSIQFSRYVEVLKRKYPRARIVLEVPDLIVWLLGHLDCEVVAGTGQHDPPPGWSPTDEHVSLMSLPHRLKCEIPPATPMRVPQAMFERIKAQYKDKFTVGICWRGSAVHPLDCFRSMDASVPQRIVDALPDVRFVSLQREWSPLERSEAMPNLCKTWRDTSAVLCAVDLVVSVDTAIAHLAGCCKRPTLLMLAKNHDFRWGSRSDSVWYPNFEVHRQAELANWDPVVESIIDGIRQRQSASSDSESCREGSDAGGKRERQRGACIPEAPELRAVLDQDAAGAR